ncbi:MAG: SpoIID/LytB domain-containing protein [Ruminococcus sp.]|nr:SpoIID/LytB domain-containing protein [Ruminococcus sp.]
MRYYAFKQKLKTAGAFLIILILLPYVVTVFIHGAESKSNEIVFNVKVKVGNDGQIIEIPWETYLTGVLANEISWQEEEEFLRAQAVLIRTRLYQNLEESEDKVLAEGYLTELDVEQELGVAKGKEYYEKLMQAVTDTGNQVLFYEETYAWTPFHYASNGTTRSAQEVMGTEAYPYLLKKECPLDKGADKEIQITEVTYREVQKKCQSFLVAVSEENADKTYEFGDFEIISHDSSGYVMEMKIGDTVCTGDQFCDALSLPSSSFTLDENNGKLKITTVGRGHGIGMSQWTAHKMAEEGASYEEILQYFFEGTTLASGGEIFTKTE